MKSGGKNLRSCEFKELPELMFEVFLFLLQMPTLKHYCHNGKYF
jgi:hypothetical protein